MRKMLTVVALAGIFAAGTAAAAVAIHRITLHPGQCVTVAKTRVCAAKAATVTVTAPPPTQTTLDFSGNGSLTLPPFTLPTGETLRWTWQNTNGDFPTGMSINDEAQSKFVVDADGGTVSGSTFLPAGQHRLSTNTIGNWTIHIGP